MPVDIRTTDYRLDQIIRYGEPVMPVDFDLETFAIVRENTPGSKSAVSEVRRLPDRIASNIPFSGQGQRVFDGDDKWVVLGVEIAAYLLNVRFDRGTYVIEPDGDFPVGTILEHSDVQYRVEALGDHNYFVPNVGISKASGSVRDPIRYLGVDTAHTMWIYSFPESYAAAPSGAARYERGDATFDATAFTDSTLGNDNLIDPDFPGFANSQQRKMFGAVFARLDKTPPDAPATWASIDDFPEYSVDTSSTPSELIEASLKPTWAQELSRNAAPTEDPEPGGSEVSFTETVELLMRGRPVKPGDLVKVRDDLFSVASTSPIDRNRFSEVSATRSFTAFAY